MPVLRAVGGVEVEKWEKGEGEQMTRLLPFLALVWVCVLYVVGVP